MHVKPVISNQTGPHDRLLECAEKHKASRFERPIAEHTQQAFDAVLPWLINTKNGIILDSCCGVGQSTAMLGMSNPDIKVLGVDKSIARLDKHHAYAHHCDNYKTVRADLQDFWRLLADASIKFKKHYLLYPNPYPKSTQLQKRWHAGPLMPAIMSLSDNIEVRSNWLVYLQEFEQVAMLYGYSGQITPLVSNRDVTTPFEEKYLASSQTCFVLNLERTS